MIKLPWRQSHVRQPGSIPGISTFIDRSNWFSNIELPIIGRLDRHKCHLWKRTICHGTQSIFLRGRFQGNQLPYLDTVKLSPVSVPLKLFELWITNGEIDFQARHISTASSYTNLLKTNETEGNYSWCWSYSAWATVMQLNLGCKNLKLREFFSDRNVRVALNLAIDREKINELIYNGLYTPSQYAPIKASPQYYEKASNANINHGVAKANDLLDTAGYTQKNADGVTVFIKMEANRSSLFSKALTMTGPSDADCQSEICKMWTKAIGIKANYKFVERSLYEAAAEGQ